jgi:hypothetical protein
MTSKFQRQLDLIALHMDKVLSVVLVVGYIAFVKVIP